MRHTMITLAPILLVAACADQSASPTAEANGPTALVSQSPIVHRVSVGGPDQCTHLGQKPGCNGNFSLIAMQREDGSVSGQMSDRYGDRFGMHAEVDCLVVQVIPERTTLEAWVGGVVTSPEFRGHRVITKMRDNGTSMNDPRPDAISRAIIDPEDEGVNSNCQDKPDMNFGQTPQGQVTIW